MSDTSVSLPWNIFGSDGSMEIELELANIQEGSFYCIQWNWPVRSWIDPACLGEVITCFSRIIGIVIPRMLHLN
jgi:hypothetical protein